MGQISHGGARQKPGRLARRWMRFWVKWNGPGLFGRLASWAAPPNLDHVSLGDKVAIHTGTLLDTGQPGARYQTPQRIKRYRHK
jgi:hypothetical protein